MKPDFRAFVEAAEFLGQREQKYIIEQMERALDDGTYFVAFVGHYSAGKSRLINNLLGRDLLPVGITETTPLLTYICYGAQETAKIHYCDGAVQIIPVEQIKELRQGRNSTDMDKLEYIEIFLPVEYLRNGMILVDTPGVNTVIERHQRLLSSTLALASKVVYVAGHAISAVDEETLGIINERGLDLSFVRTHFDELKAQEDDPDDVIRSDLEMLARFGLAPESCFHLSNLSDSKWYGGIESLRKTLADKGVNAQEELLRAAEEKLRSLAGQFIPALEERKAVLEALINNDKEALETKKRDCERRIQSIEQNILARRKRIEAQMAQYKRSLGGEISRRAKEELEESARRISNASSEIKSGAEMSALFKDEAGSWLDKLSMDIDELCNVALKEINEDNAELMRAVDMDEDAIPVIDNYEELIDTQDDNVERLCSQLQQIVQNRSAIEASLQSLENSPDVADLKQNLIELEKHIMELRQEYTSFPEYEPQLIDASDGSPQPSQIMKTLGNAADWVLMLAPGASLGAVAGKLAKATKVTRFVAKALGGAEKVTKIIAKGDSIKDTLYALRNMKKTYATAKRIKKAEQIMGSVGTVAKLSGLFDCLTVEHWAEKLGKQFDSPPQLIEDEEYKEQYLSEKRAIEQSILREQQKAYQKKREMKLYKDKKSQLEAELNANNVDEERVRWELEKRKSKIRAEAQKKAHRNWCQECAQRFTQQMTTVLKNIISRVEEEVPERIDRYQQEQIEALLEKLLGARQEYDALQQTDPSKYVESIEEAASILERLKLKRVQDSSHVR